MFCASSEVAQLIICNALLTGSGAAVPNLVRSPVAEACSQEVTRVLWPISVATREAELILDPMYAGGEMLVK